MSSSQQRQRTASFSITIPAGLLPSLDAAAASYRSRTALLERRIVDSDPLYTRSRVIGLSFDDINRLGRWLRLEITESRKIRESESALIVDRLSSIKITPITTQPRRSQPLELAGPTRTLSIRTLPPVKAKAETLAEASGLSLSGLCLRLLIGQPIYAKPSNTDARIISELGKISGLLILCDSDHADLFINRDHHRQATQLVNALLQKWRA